MFVKIKNGESPSEWTRFDMELLEKLRLSPPAAVVIRIGDFYGRSPEADAEQEVTFDVFVTLAYEFMLMADRERKNDANHLEGNAYDYLEDVGKVSGTNQECRLAQFALEFRDALETLPPLMRKRARLYYEIGLTQQEIALLDGVDQAAVSRSIKAATRRLQLYFL